MTVRIVTDSSCDIPQELADELGIEIVPLSIRFGDEEFVDRVELSTEDFWTKVAQSPLLPETAAPSAGAFEERFRALAADGADGIVCICLTSRLSATMQAALLGAKALEGVCEIRVIDSMSASMGVGLHCITAAALAKQGQDVDQIASVIEDQVTRTHLFATLDTLDHLRKGGRISGMKALMGGALSVKPILTITDGLMVEAGKVRTRSKSLKYLADKLKETNAPTSVYVFHAQAPDIEEFLEMVGEIVPREDIAIGIIGPVIGSHGGPGTIGLGWVDKT